MKNLKINLGLFSLLAVLAVSVFFTSCEQEELIEDTIDGVHELNAFSISDVDDSSTLDLSELFNDMSEEELQAFLMSASEEEISDLLAPFVSNDEISEISERGCPQWKSIYHYCKNGKFYRVVTRRCNGKQEFRHFYTSNCW